MLFFSAGHDVLIFYSDLTSISFVILYPPLEKPILNSDIRLTTSEDKSNTVSGCVPPTLLENIATSLFIILPAGICILIPMKITLLSFLIACQ